MAVATVKRTFKAQYCHWDQDGNGISHSQDGIIFFEAERRRFDNSPCARSKAFTVAAARSFGTSPVAECISFAIWKPSGACTAAVQQLAASLAKCKVLTSNKQVRALAANQARLHRQQSERCRCRAIEHCHCPLLLYVKPFNTSVRQPQIRGTLHTRGKSSMAGPKTNTW